MESNTLETATQTTDVALPAPSPHDSPAHQGMVNYLAEVMHHNQQAGLSAYDTILNFNRCEAQLAAIPSKKLLEQYATYASMNGTDPNAAVNAVVACAEAKTGREFFAELHCDALDQLAKLEKQDARKADREYHVIRAAALAHYTAEQYLDCNQYLTHKGINVILQQADLNDHEMSAARALFMSFQREKIPAIVADKEQYHARATERQHIAASHAAGA